MNKTILKIFICFTLSSALISLILLIINFTGIAFIQSDVSSSFTNSGSYILEKISENMEVSENSFNLKDTSVIPEGSWCILIDEDGNVIWDYDKPSDIPDHYTINDVAKMTRWFLNDYPVYVRTEDYGLLVLGAPKDSVGKYEIQYSMKWFDTLPQRILGIIVLNLILSTFLALLFGSTLYKRLRTLTDGINNLRLEKKVHLKEKGIFKEISKNINETSESIARKNAALLSRDNARSNWIAGVSHDIRTPLSMVMGYSESLSASSDLSEENKAKARLITAQSIKIKKMVDDLNLISSLEYDMQPAKKKEVKICPLIRNIITEIINNGLSEKYEINLDFKAEKAAITGDESLLERAFFNIVNNAVVHNEDGCTINIYEYTDNGNVYIKITDNGSGISEDIINNISVIPKSAHGLGLPMAYKIINVHGGKMFIKNDSGLSILISFPCI